MLPCLLKPMLQTDVFWVGWQAADLGSLSQMGSMMSKRLFGIERNQPSGQLNAWVSNGEGESCLIVG